MFIIFDSTKHCEPFRKKFKKNCYYCHHLSEKQLFFAGTKSIFTEICKSLNIITECGKHSRSEEQKKLIETNKVKSKKLYSLLDKTFFKKNFAKRMKLLLDIK